jgi:hypothetical protein
MIMGLAVSVPATSIRGRSLSTRNGCPHPVIPFQLRGQTADLDGGVRAIRLRSGFVTPI